MDVVAEVNRSRAVALNLINKLKVEEGEIVYAVDVMHVTEERAQELIEYAKKVLSVEVIRKEYPATSERAWTFVVYELGPVKLFVRPELS